jgi:hypothetical protein
MITIRGGVSFARYFKSSGISGCWRSGGWTRSGSESPGFTSRLDPAGHWPSGSKRNPAAGKSELAPNSKILFVTANRSGDIAEEALRTGALGYVVKAEATKELLPAINTVLQDKMFVSAGLADLSLARPKDQQAQDHLHVAPFQEANREVIHRHESKVYPDDAAFVEGLPVLSMVRSGWKSSRCSCGHVTPRWHSSEIKFKSVDVDAIEGTLCLLDVADSLQILRLENAVRGLTKEMRHQRKKLSRWS